MTAQSLRRSVLLGNSFGCQIIVEFALRHPERLAGAVLVGPTVEPSARAPLRLLMRLLRDAARERPSEVSITLRDYWRYGVRRGWATFRLMAADPIEQKLPGMAAPILVVRGGRNPIGSQRWAETVTALLPAGQLLVISEAAHAVNYDAPAALVNAVRRFLNDHRDAS